MRRRLYILGSVVSLLLCVATCALWVRSHWVADAFHRIAPPPGGRNVTIASTRGGLTVSATVISAPKRARRPPLWTTSAPHSPRVRGPLPGEPGVRAHLSWSAFGFFWTDGGTKPVGPLSAGLPLAGGATSQMTYFPSWQAAVPHWSIAALAGAAAWAFARRTRSAARRPGHCAACGYDLRATPDRCPECGAEPA